MHLVNKLFLILFFFLLSYSVYGQDGLFEKRTFFITKALDNEDNSISIPFAHVYNESFRSSAISDTLGIIKIRANISDTLVITAVGYYPKLIVVNEMHLTSDYPVTTILKRRTYEIKEVSVHALGTYQQFKKKVENLDLAYTETEQLRIDLKEQSVKEAKDAFEKAKSEKLLATSPIERVTIATVPILSETERQIKQYNEMLKKEERKAIMYAKFNKVIVQKLTTLEEPELTDFFVYCDFDEEFLYVVSDYEVQEAIKEKYTLYLAMKEKQNGTKDTIAN